MGEGLGRSVRRPFLEAPACPPQPRTLGKSPDGSELPFQCPRVTMVSSGAGVRLQGQQGGVCAHVLGVLSDGCWPHLGISAPVLLRFCLGLRPGPHWLKRQIRWGRMLTGAGNDAARGAVGKPSMQERREPTRPAPLQPQGCTCAQRQKGVSQRAGRRRHWARNALPTLECLLSCPQAWLAEPRGMKVAPRPWLPGAVRSRPREVAMAPCLRGASAVLKARNLNPVWPYGNYSVQFLRRVKQETSQKQSTALAWVLSPACRDCLDRASGPQVTWLSSSSPLHT